METLTGVAVGGVIQRGEREINSTQTLEKDIRSLLFFKLTLNEHTGRWRGREECFATWGIMLSLRSINYQKKKKSQHKTWKIALGIVSQGSLRESPNKIDYYYFWLLTRI